MDLEARIWNLRDELAIRNYNSMLHQAGGSYSLSSAAQIPMQVRNTLAVFDGKTLTLLVLLVAFLLYARQRKSDETLFQFMMHQKNKIVTYLSQKLGISRAPEIVERTLDNQGIQNAANQLFVPPQELSSEFIQKFERIMTQAFREGLKKSGMTNADRFVAHLNPTFSPRDPARQ